MAVVDFLEFVPKGVRLAGQAALNRLLPEPVSSLGAVHLLGDLLEALEFACDELMAARYEPRLDVSDNHPDTILQRTAALRDFIDRLESQELAIAAKLDRARLWAGLVGRSDQRLRLIASLFYAGTNGLVDVLPRLADPAETIFNTGSQQLNFLMTRGLIVDARATADGSVAVAIGRDYVLCGVLPIGDLSDLVTQTLNALDAHYNLYEAEGADDESESVAAVAAADLSVTEAPITEALPSDPVDIDTAMAVVINQAELIKQFSLDLDSSPESMASDIGADAGSVVGAEVAERTVAEPVLEMLPEMVPEPAQIAAPAEPVIASIGDDALDEKVAELAAAATETAVQESVATAELDASPDETAPDDLLIGTIETEASPFAFAEPMAPATDEPQALVKTMPEAEPVPDGAISGSNEGVNTPTADLVGVTSQAETQAAETAPVASADLEPVAPEVATDSSEPAATGSPALLPVEAAAEAAPVASLTDAPADLPVPTETADSDEEAPLELGAFQLAGAAGADSEPSLSARLALVSTEQTAAA